METETLTAIEKPFAETTLQQKRVQLAWKDIKTALLSWRVWLMLSWQDIRLRYRRSSLGPFWMTLSMAISIYTMGFLYGHLFKVDLHIYYPFLAAGLLVWNLLYLFIIDSTNAFIEAENYLKQIKLPYSIFIMRAITRSLIMFAHNVVVLLPIYIFLRIHFSLDMFLFFPNLLIVTLTAIGFGMILALFGARFRDVTQIIISLMQVAFFLTPIIWNHAILPAKYQFVVALNPFAQYLELLRAPLTGNIASAYTYSFTLFFMVLGLLLAFYLLVRVRHRIIYWL